MLPFGIDFGLTRVLLDAAFLPHSEGTSVVCVLAGLEEATLSVADFRGVAFVAIVVEEEERGGEGLGGRPIDGANWGVLGRSLVSRGFRNM